jgi:hypothetical protein
VGARGRNTDCCVCVCVCSAPLMDVYGQPHNEVSGGAWHGGAFNER